MESYDVKKLFDRYTETTNLREADVFHLYDTGEECIKDNSGFYDSRHFELIAFNTRTLQKMHCGRHDWIISYKTDLPVQLLRVFADGSFFVSFKWFAKIELFQEASLV